MSILQVGLGDRSYPIIIEPGCLQSAAPALASDYPASRYGIIADDNVARHYGHDLQRSFERAGRDCDLLVFDHGEAHKHLGTVATLISRAAQKGFDRKSMFIALGGGVTGDVAGFVAATYMRGVPFIQIPTSLLAQVDSSVGGKTGINTRHGKNLVGAFHQPSLVLADVGALATLPRRDLLAGYGEVAKYGLLGDADFFAWLERHGPALVAGDAGLRAEAVRRSCAMKAGIVARDEREEGERMLLNLGHTFAHALEAATGYSERLLHGEAVAVGCALAFDLSARLGVCAQEAPSRVRAHLQAMGMRRDLAGLDLPSPEALLALMAQDKKVRAGRLRFVLARGVGEAFVTSDVPPEAVRETLAEGLAERA
jgi:3-dehydroquinate synthase